MVEQELYLLKLGGSIITDKSKPQQPNLVTIRRDLRQIKEARERKPFMLILGHGGGGYAHMPAKKYRVNEGLVYEDSKKGAAITHLGAKALNTLVVTEGLGMGLPLFPFHPSSFGIWKEGKPRRVMLDSMRVSMGCGFIPVTHGDVVIDSEKGVSIASTENVFLSLVPEMKPTKIILATNVDGVLDYTGNSPTEPIKLIDGKSLGRLLGITAGSRNTDVTGGMRTKLDLLYEMVRKSNREGLIINGCKRDRIFKALLGEDVTGTIVRK